MPKAKAAQKTAPKKVKSPKKAIAKKPKGNKKNP